MSWIEARLKCSLHNAWTLLRETMLSDIEQWRKLTKAGADSPAVAQTDTQITITANTDEPSEIWVSVFKAKGHINVRRPDPAQPKAFIVVCLIPRLNQAGECRLWFEAQELEFWQASRLILESVLFED